ncbi:hypothetical protein B0H21DRAFT_838674 [Amylocystis lapponica]|nr:hypothetical protein B0H21DRAFT_838674 [Amylocystis lapponica]
MRVRSCFFAVLSIGLPLVSARAFSELTRRTTTDTCASLVNKPLNVPVAGTGGTVAIGIINTCLCDNAITPLVNSGSNVVVAAAVVIAGAAAVSSSLANLVATASGSQTCTYPDVAVPQCSAANPCGFTCSNGFTVSAGNCVCDAPNIVCNGVCGAFGAQCPSAFPIRRDGASPHAHCGAGLTACGVYGWGRDAWECVDTAEDLESCGGCAVPLGALSPRGTDCTAIMGVADVSCAAGACRVRSCLPGYEVAPSGTFCVRTAVFGLDGGVSAAAYGLEHVPMYGRV